MKIEDMKSGDTLNISKKMDMFREMLKQTNERAEQLVGVAGGIAAMIESILLALPTDSLIVPEVGEVRPRMRAREAIAAAQAIKNIAGDMSSDTFLLLGAVDRADGHGPEVGARAN